MIKFFRSIRQESLAQNKVIRYLLYAIGEIVLVVIGIIIALTITDWNDKRKKEQKIELIFEDILSDLSADITETTGLMRYYEEKDTLINLVLKGNVTFDDYESDKIPRLWDLTISYIDANLIQNGYNNLIQDLDAIPVKYKSITQELNKLYGRDKNNVIYFNTEVRNMVDNNVEILSRNYSWFSYPHPDSLINSLMMKESIQYYLTDFKYRNEVMNYRINGLGNHLLFAVKYRADAIECYKKIATLLNKPVIDKSFELDPKLLKILLGKWKLADSSNFIMTIYLEDDKLFYKNNTSVKMNEIYPISKTKLLTRNGTYFTLIKEDDTYVLKYTDGSYKKVAK